MSALTTAHEFVEACDVVDTRAAVLELLVTTLGRFGLDRAIFLGLPGIRERTSKVLARHWPEEWFGHYISKSYHVHDDVREHMRTSTHPFHWRDVQVSPKGTLARRIAEEAREHGLASGYCVPLYSSVHWQSGVSMGSEWADLRLDGDDRAAVNLVAMVANNAILRMAKPRGAVLSEREREVLQWSVEGKSAWEIGVILSISEPTVKKHLLSIRRKYDVGTTLHAVVEGLRRREIGL